MNRFAKFALAKIVLLQMFSATQLMAQESTGVTVELNKIEASETGGCQAFFLFKNETKNTFDGFELSLAVLDTAGVIDRLLTIDAAPVPAQRTTLKLFEIPEIECNGISQILLHDMTSCRQQNSEEMDCFPILTLNSRASAQLVK